MALYQGKQALGYEVVAEGGSTPRGDSTRRLQNLLYHLPIWLACQDALESRHILYYVFRPVFSSPTRNCQHLNCNAIYHTTTNDVFWLVGSPLIPHGTLVCFAGLTGLHRLRHPGYNTYKEMMQCRHVIFLPRVPGEETLIG